jgi:hypothetical protein
MLTPFEVFQYWQILHVSELGPVWIQLIFELMKTTYANK